MSICAKFQLPILSRSGLKVSGGVVGWGVVWCSVVENDFSVKLKPKPFILTLASGEHETAQSHLLHIIMICTLLLLS